MNTGPLFGARIKIDRAKKHFDDLNGEIRAFNARQPYHIVAEIDPQTEDKIYRLGMKECVPAEWGGLVGDCIHNLRAALDFLAYALVLDNGGTPTKDTKFPISSASRNMRSDIPSGLNGASTRSKLLVERCKPYGGANNPFWRLHQIDIVDKHKLLIPVAASHRNVIIDFAWGIAALPGSNFPRPPMELAINPADRQFPLKDGDVLFVEGKSLVPNAKMDPNPKFTIDIAFGEGQIIDGEPIVPALKQLIDFTERIIRVFARHIFKCPW